MLITVGVILDTMRQIEAFLLQRHYDGFLKKGRIRARSPNSQAGALEEATDLAAVGKLCLAVGSIFVFRHRPHLGAMGAIGGSKLAPVLRFATSGDESNIVDPFSR